MSRSGGRMGIKGNFAMIGISEKGRANVKFIARGKGGHASTPQKNSPIARLSAFVCDVERHCPFRSTMEPETRAMLEALAPAASFPIRLILENLWLFRKPVEWFTPRINGQAAAMQDDDHFYNGLGIQRLQCYAPGGMGGREYALCPPPGYGGEP